MNSLPTVRQQAHWLIEFINKAGYDIRRIVITPMVSHGMNDSTFYPDESSYLNGVMSMVDVLDKHRVGRIVFACPGCQEMYINFNFNLIHGGIIIKDSLPSKMKRWLEGYMRKVKPEPIEEVMKELEDHEKAIVAMAERAERYEKVLRYVAKKASKLAKYIELELEGDRS